MGAKVNQTQAFSGNKHAYRFEGGDLLTKMGASWFVSYTYYMRKDRKHKNWAKIHAKRNLKNRISHFMPSTLYHRFWLCKIHNMDDAHLNTNKIGLTAPQVKQMAHELLDLFW